MPSYKLTYFNGRGRGEVARLLLAAADKKYEDVRIEPGQWPELKPKMPQATMPVLEVDGKFRISQSMAVNRFLARELNLYGNGTKNQAIVDQILDNLLDLFGPAITMFFNKNEDEKAEQMKKFMEETVPTQFKYLENLMKLSGSRGFAVGSSLTVADLALFSILENCKLEEAVKNYPVLAKNRETIQSLPRIKKYLENRPATAF
ncbi:hypothetical protein ACF0H5_014551 [Mactra antiquata]